MEKRSYITKEEQKRCQKIAAFYAKLEEKDIIVVDAGRFGFVKLVYYNPQVGFFDMKNFTNSEDLFEDLWQEWMFPHLFAFAKTISIEEARPNDIWNLLPRKMQLTLIEKHLEFARKCDFSLTEKENLDEFENAGFNLAPL